MTKYGASSCEEEETGMRRTFDELYEQVCGELRQLGKSIDLCEKIKPVHSDLKRVQLLLSNNNSNLVSKFTNSIRDHRGEGKSHEEAEQLLRRLSPTTKSSFPDSHEAIEILTHALLVSPWRREPEQGLEWSEKLLPPLLVNEIQPRTRAVNANCVHYLVKRLQEKNEVEASAFPDAGQQQDQSCLLPSIYLERAQRLSELGEHEAVILNTVLALSFASHLQPSCQVTFKVVVNVATSLGALNFSQEANQVFHHALALLRQDTKTDKETKCKETLKVVQALKRLKNGRSGGRRPYDEKRKAPSVEQLYGGRNEKLGAASNALELRYDTKRGRHAVAKTSIPPGATLIVDTPYAWSIYPRVYQRLCQHCCFPTLAPIPCPQCSSVVFCCWECWQQSESYHKFECSILKSLDSSAALGEMGLLCYRIVAKTDLQVLKQCAAQILKTEETERAGGETEVNMGLVPKCGQFLDPTHITAVLAMTPNSEQRPAGDIIKRTLAAIYLTLCLRHTGYFHRHSEFNKKPDSPAESNDDEYGAQLSESECLVAAMLLRLSQSLSCNAYGINGLMSCNGSNNGTETIESFGGAVFPTISMLNHSCNPNAFRFTWGNTCVVRTIRRIQEGEEVLDSYGPLFTTMRKADRRNLLKTQYFFQCECQACEEDWPLLRDFPSARAARTVKDATGYKCSVCSKPVAIPATTATQTEDKHCLSCHGKMDKKRMRDTLFKSEQRYLTAKAALIGQRELLAESESIFAAHLDVLEKCLVPPQRLIVECQEMLKLAWNVAAGAERTE